MDNFELLIWSSCQATFEYVFAVKAKYLQMLVAYSIFKEDPDQVADHFEQFNRDFGLMCNSFHEVTGDSVIGDTYS